MPWLDSHRKGEDCFDGFLYNWDGKNARISIDIVTEDWPRIYANGKQISLDELHSGDLVMLYTNWQIDEIGLFRTHCDNYSLSWVKQVDVIKCPLRVKRTGGEKISSESTCQ